MGIFGIVGELNLLHLPILYKTRVRQLLIKIYHLISNHPWFIGFLCVRFLCLCLFRVSFVCLCHMSLCLQTYPPPLMNKPQLLLDNCVCCNQSYVTGKVYFLWTKRLSKEATIESRLDGVANRRSTVVPWSVSFNIKQCNEQMMFFFFFSFLVLLLFWIKLRRLHQQQQQHEN